MTLTDSLHQRLPQLAEQRQQGVQEVAASLLDSALPPQVDEREDKANVAREQAAYRAVHNELVQHHLGQHVAIFEGKLVDTDQGGLSLSQRIYEKYPDEFVLIRRVESQPERVLYFRSPRFVRT